jgi:hypothetical protein
MRGLLIAALVVACVVIGIGAVLLRSGVNTANFSRIQIGMTDAEVAVLLGEQPNANMLLLGRIASPDAFANDGQQSWYLYREWRNARITIVTFSDPKTGRVVCRYSGQGYLAQFRQLLPW